MRPRVDVLIASIPPRADSGVLARAHASVSAQDYEALCHVRTLVDRSRRGAAQTRNELIEQADTEWIAFLDDDDELYPFHLRQCMDFADALGADVVYPGYDVEGGEDLVNLFGQRFNPDWLRVTNFIPVTVVARTELVRAAGGFQPHPDINGDPCEDWGLWLAMLDLGARFEHLPNRTWIWHMDGSTRGRGDRW